MAFAACFPRARIFFEVEGVRFSGGWFLTEGVFVGGTGDDSAVLAVLLSLVSPSLASH
jgi:hypothetical protein